jgi:hypothetical protein
VVLILKLEEERVKRSKPSSFGNMGERVGLPPWGGYLIRDPSIKKQHLLKEKGRSLKMWAAFNLVRYF